MTNRTPGIVSEVSATLVASTTRRRVCPANTLSWSGPVSRPYSGSTSQSTRLRTSRSRVSRICFSPGRNTSASPRRPRAIPLQFLERIAHGLGQRRRRLVLFRERSIAHLDRVALALDVDDGRAAEELRETLRLDRRRRHDQAQVGTLRQQAVADAEQEIDVEVALVGFVDDQRVVAQQQRVAFELAQQQAVGHQLDQRARTGAVDEAHLVTDEVADRGAEFRADSIGQGLRRDAPRLGVPDQAGGTAPHLEADLGQLRALAAAGRATDDDDLVRLDRAADVVASRVHGQGFVVDDRRNGGAARRDEFGGCLDLGLQPRHLARIGRRGLARQAVQRRLQPTPIAQQALREQVTQGRETRCDGIGCTHGGSAEFPLGTNPERFESLHVDVAGVLTLRREVRLDLAEAPFELGVCVAQRGFRIDVQVTGRLRQREQQVAEFFVRAGAIAPVDFVLQLAEFFANLVDDTRRVGPVEADLGRARTELGRAGQRRQAERHAVQRAGALSLGCALGALVLFPGQRLRRGIFDPGVGKHVRMTTLELVGDRRGDGVEIEQAAFLGDARLEHDLEQHVTQFVAHGLGFAAGDRIRQFVRLLDRVRRDRRPVLLAVPGTALLRVAQARP